MCQLTLQTDVVYVCLSIFTCRYKYLFNACRMPKMPADEVHERTHNFTHNSTHNDTHTSPTLTHTPPPTRTHTRARSLSHTYDTPLSMKYITYDGTFYHHIIVVRKNKFYKLDVVVDGEFWSVVGPKRLCLSWYHPSSPRGSS